MKIKLFLHCSFLSAFIYLYKSMVLIKNDKLICELFLESFRNMYIYELEVDRKQTFLITKVRNLYWWCT